MVDALEKLERMVYDYLANREKRDMEESARIEKFQNEVRSTMEEYKEDLKKAERIRETLLSYTLQIVGIIVGLLAISLSIFLLLFKTLSFEMFEYLLCVLVGFLIMIFVWLICVILKTRTSRKIKIRKD